MALLQTQFSLVDLYYPETQGLVLIVNCPWLLAASWRLLKGLLDAKTAENVRAREKISSVPHSLPDPVR